MTKYFFHSGEMPKVTHPSFVQHGFDRTNSLFEVKNVIPVLPIGKLTSTKFLQDLLDLRSSEIFSKLNGRSVYVFWSGGIDSTAVLVALLKIVPSDLLTVVMSQSSIKEYPDFYFGFIENKVKTKFVDVSGPFQINNSLDNYLKDGVVVTGELADQLFGADYFVDLSIKNPDYLVQNWESFYDKTNAINKYKSFASKCPFTIKTHKEFRWWFNYCVKYNSVVFRMLRNTYSFKLEQNVFHFFNTNDFNDWGVSTPMEEKFYGTDIRHYKMPLKNYIYSFTKDLNYKNNKIKEGSLYNILANKNPFNKLSEWSCVDSEGVVIK